MNEAKGGRTWLASLTAMFGAAAGALATALVNAASGHPAWLVVLVLGLMLTGLIVALTIVWLGGGIIHIREYRLLADRCALLERQLERANDLLRGAQSINERATAGGGPP